MIRLSALALVVTAACVDTTGGQTVTYGVAARGIALPGNVVDTGSWRVGLTRAVVHLGAVYLNLAVANPEVSAGTECILPGIYTGEELAGLDVDVLSTAPQPFPAPAVGTNDEARTGELWLTGGGDINAKDDATIIADVCGTATSADATMIVPFAATVTIGSNRLIASDDGANPSAHPICKQRIVSPIAIDFSPSDGGTLLVTVDPTLWFTSVDFSTLPATTTPPASCPGATFAFPDSNALTASHNLFDGLHYSGGTYALSFASPGESP